MTLKKHHLNWRSKVKEKRVGWFCFKPGDWKINLMDRSLRGQILPEPSFTNLVYRFDYKSGLWSNFYLLIGEINEIVSINEQGGERGWYGDFAGNIFMGIWSYTLSRLRKECTKRIKQSIYFERSLIAVLWLIRRYVCIILLYLEIRSWQK